MWFLHPRNPVPVMPVVQEPAETEDDGCYTVGVTNDNRTVMKVTAGYATLELSLNDAAVRQMIKLLEATLREENDQSTPQSDEPVV
jgi:hypothetical protein